MKNSNLTEEESQAFDFEMLIKKNSVLRNWILVSFAFFVSTLWCSSDYDSFPTLFQLVVLLHSGAILGVCGIKWVLNRIKMAGLAKLDKMSIAYIKDASCFIIATLVCLLIFSNFWGIIGTNFTKWAVTYLYSTFIYTMLLRDEFLLGYGCSENEYKHFWDHFSAYLMALPFLAAEEAFYGFLSIFGVKRKAPDNSHFAENIY